MTSGEIPEAPLVTKPLKEVVDEEDLKPFDAELHYKLVADRVAELKRQHQREEDK